MYTGKIKYGQILKVLKMSSAAVLISALSVNRDKRLKRNTYQILLFICMRKWLTKHIYYNIT